MRIDVQVRSGIPRLTDELRRQGSRIVRKAAFDIDARTKINIVGYEAVDTGFMLNSVRSESVGPLEAQSVVGAEYGPYVHDGANGREARPFQDDAVLDVAPAFEQAVKDLFDRANRTVP